MECSQCGGAGVGAPFQDIIIDNQGFELHLIYGACTTEHIQMTYKYQSVVDSFQLSSLSKTIIHCTKGILKDKVETYPQHLQEEYFRTENRNY